MPFLNWTQSAGVTLRVEAHPSLGKQLALTLDGPAMSALVAALKDAFSDPARELRLDLPESWLVFWKLRDGESRIFLAHPGQDEWVANASLEKAHADALVQTLENGGAGAQGVAVSALGALHRMSNLEILLSSA